MAGGSSKDKENNRDSRRKTRPGKRKSRKRKPAIGKGSSGDELLNGEKIHHLLDQLHRKLTSRKKTDKSSDAISLRFFPGGDAAAFARELVDTFKSTRGSEGHVPHFVPGRVYCYHCDSCVCFHSVPPNHLSVFTGYTPTGFPVWNEISAVFLETKNPRIDDIVEDPPKIVAACMSGDNLNAEQLPVFGKESPLYDIWGQVIAGHLPLPRGKNNGRTAVTLQAVRCLIHSRSSMRLNIIGKVSGGGDLVDYLRAEPEPELEGLFTATRNKLDRLTAKTRASRSAHTPKKHVSTDAVMPILRHLARGIEGVFRRSRRRTRHAMKRRAERPAVGLALKDLKKAQQDRILFDEKHRTFIVIGPKWRVHVFGHDHKHVTSMALDKEGVRKRIDTKRWRYMSGEEIEKFRLILSSVHP